MAILFVIALLDAQHHAVTFTNVEVLSHQSPINIYIEIPLLFTAQHITVVKDKDCRCILHNLLHEFQEQFNDCMNLKHYNESMLRDNDYGKMMTRIFSVPVFKSDMCLISIVEALVLAQEGVMALRRAPLSLRALKKNQRIPVLKEHLTSFVSLGLSTAKWWCPSH